MRPTHLPEGVAAEVMFAIDNEIVRIAVPEPKDPFDVCNQARARCFPGVELPQRDTKFERIMQARKASAPQVEGLDVPRLGTRAPARAGVRDTSLAAHREVKASGKLGTQQRQLVEFMRSNPGAYTRQEISKATGWAINRICPRVHELIALGVLAECAPRKCSATGETAHPLVLADAMEAAA